MSAQSMEALGVARQTRTDRAIVKRQLVAGELGLDDAVSAELLAFLPWWGERARPAPAAAARPRS